MKSISRLRVLSDRIPRVLVFVYFCRGLSGNTEERPTRRDYIEISTCRAIILHLEDSRSHGNEAKAHGAWPWAPAQETRAPAPYRVQSKLSFGIKLHRPKGSRITVQSMSVWSNGPYSLGGTIKPDPLAPGEGSLSTLIHYSQGRRSL